MAADGDSRGVDFLLTQPTLSPEAQQHYDAWLFLASDCAQFSHSLGMAGGLLLRQRLTRAAVRMEGERLCLDGDALEDFVEIVKRIDLVEWIGAFKAQAADLAAAQKKSHPAGR